MLPVDMSYMLALEEKGWKKSIMKLKESEIG